MILFYWWQVIMWWLGNNWQYTRTSDDKIHDVIWHHNTTIQETSIQREYLTPIKPILVVTKFLKMLLWNSRNVNHFLTLNQNMRVSNIAEISKGPLQNHFQIFHHDCVMTECLYIHCPSNWRAIHKGMENCCKEASTASHDLINSSFISSQKYALKNIIIEWIEI